jgi:hypothetical protein
MNALRRIGKIAAVLSALLLGGAFVAVRSTGLLDNLQVFGGEGGGGQIAANQKPEMTAGTPAVMPSSKFGGGVLAQDVDAVHQWVDSQAQKSAAQPVIMSSSKSAPVFAAPGPPTNALNYKAMGASAYKSLAVAAIPNASQAYRPASIQPDGPILPSAANLPAALPESMRAEATLADARAAADRITRSSPHVVTYRVSVLSDGTVVLVARSGYSPVQRAQPPSGNAAPMPQPQSRQRNSPPAGNRPRQEIMPGSKSGMIFQPKVDQS